MDEDESGGPRVHDLRGISTPHDAATLYGPGGEPVSRAEAEEAERERTQREERPEVTCDYCGQTAKKRENTLQPGPRWRLPEEWRKLPNGLTECPGCRPVQDVETGRMVRPDPEMRGGTK